MASKRNTIQKQIILDSVGVLDIHATAEQVYQHVASMHPTISKATVYRNLREAAELGELLNIGAMDGSTHYDHRTHSHSHFMCEICGQVFDVEGDFSDVLNRAQATSGIKVDDYQLTFSGRCEACEQLRAN